MTKKINIYLIFLGIVVIGGGIFFYYWQYWRILPDKPATYYKIFDKTEILDGNETQASQVIEKLDKRLAKYQKTFAQMAGTNDETKLRALFYMNFVHMFGYYGKRESGLKEKTFQELLWGDEYFDCGTYAMFLAMLLDKAGFEFRTLAFYPGHGIVEIKFDNRWQVLDPTTNLWIDQSIEDQIAGKSRQIKEFFLTAEDLSNSKARENLTKGFKVNVIELKDFMLKIGQGSIARIGQYDYIKLADYQY